MSHKLMLTNGAFMALPFFEDVAMNEAGLSKTIKYVNNNNFKMC